MVENPFPGMNPYLEQRWGDVHAALIAYARDMIQEVLPSELRARMQERVFIESDVKERAYYPQVPLHKIVRLITLRCGAPRKSMRLSMMAFLFASPSPRLVFRCVPAIRTSARIK